MFPFVLTQHCECTQTNSKKMSRAKQTWQEPKVDQQNKQQRPLDKASVNTSKTTIAHLPNQT